MRRVGLYAGERIVFADMPAGRGAAPCGRALGRDVIDPLLLSAAGSAGAEILQPWRATGFERDAEGWTVAVRTKHDERSLTAPVLIAAHGSWEPGPLPTQSLKRNEPSDLLGFKAHFRGGGLPEDLMPLFVVPGGYGGLVWADGGRLSLSCCIRRDVLEAARSASGGGAGAAVAACLTARCRGVREALDGAALDGEWLAAGPIRPGIRALYADDIFRVGNVAGEAHPIIAEGISMGLQGGWLLAQALARTDLRDPAARAEAGRRYRRAWRGQFATRIRAASLLARTLTSRPGPAMAGALATAWPGALTVGAAYSGKATPLMTAP